MVKQITEGKDIPRTRKKEKKSFWFEYAKKKGVDPHKSAWREFSDELKSKRDKELRYCSKCGASIHPEGKFCERCGQRVG